MICQKCGVEAETKYVAFYQNIGLLVMRLSNSMEGNLCKSCVHGTFWQYTLVTLCFGWFGIISLIVTPFFVLNNFLRYIFCLGMQTVPPDATPPVLTDDAIDRLHPLTDDLISQLNAGEDFDRVAENIAYRANVTKGKVALWLRHLKKSKVSGNAVGWYDAERNEGMASADDLSPPTPRVMPRSYAVGNREATGRDRITQRSASCSW